ncbi:cutinase family protein [Nocardia salmonicida]|uniref:cutinase family protein n=1 Tax=Nocardia salmonicida TaxID=53431 RepID=UPI000A053D3C|nr:cutinase family protein [Nocardia salmonicida]
MKNRFIAYSIAAFTVAVSTLVIPGVVASAAPCSDVDVTFARGTGELPGLGITGTPFVNSVKSQLAGRSVSTYAVDYSANASQTSAGPGSRDLVDHVTSVAAACPATQFVIGGYSQGATAVSNAVGLRTPSSSTGAVLPGSVTDRIKAVVVFGNPLGLTGERIETSSSVYATVAKSFCNFGDPVCQLGGIIGAAHLTYGTNGSTTTGATFASSRIASASS